MDGKVVQGAPIYLAFPSLSQRLSLYVDIVQMTMSNVVDVAIVSISKIRNFDFLGEDKDGEPVHSIKYWNDNSR